MNLENCIKRKSKTSESEKRSQVRKSSPRIEAGQARKG
jgi:hypothetical protein